jgi:cytochrome c oxidase assembly protein subunit 15
VSDVTYKPWLHRLALLTAVVSLLPIVMGALVTTKDAGMAFRDWPTSDGQGMFEYPWLQSIGDKFLEHGHRLAGIVIGLASIALCVGLGSADSRRWVKGLGLLALLSVIGQGLLGGQRVLLDARGLAFVHGSCAALVFGLLSAIAVVTSRRWFEQEAAPAGDALRRLRVLSYVTTACVFVQYVLGGLLRHQGKALHEHLGFAFIAAAMMLLLAFAALGSGRRWFRFPATVLLVGTVLQLILGAGAWVTRFGFGDFVAVYGSHAQIAFRTSHVLAGMMLFASCIVMAVRVTRQDHAERRAMPVTPNPTGMPRGIAAGGLR